ncbi:MAG: pepsin-like aspartic protease [Myxococcales bacterium]
MDPLKRLGCILWLGLPLAATACGGASGPQTCVTSADCGGDFICNRGECFAPVVRPPGGGTTAAGPSSSSSGSTGAGTTSEAASTSSSGGQNGSSSSGGTPSSSSSSSSSSSAGGSSSGGVSSGGSSSAGASSTAGGSTSSGGSSGSSTSGGGSTSGGSSSSGSASGGGPYVTVPLNGCPMLGYNAPVTVGGTQTFQMTIDTGSTDTAVALSTCSSCGVSPEFSPGSVCSNQQVSAQYGTGSWNGNVCSTTVQVGAELPAVSIDFAGITTQSQFFEPYDCSGNNASPIQGILGMGPISLDNIGQNSNDAYFSELVQSGVTDNVGFLLCSSGGAMWFGGYDPQYADPSASIQYTAMTNSGYWSVSLSDIGLGGSSLGGADPNAVVDTGTGVFLMASAAITALENSLSSNSAATTIFGSGKLGSSFFSGSTINCISAQGGQSPSQVDAQLPPLTLTFPGVNGGSFTLTMPATQSYLIPVGSGSQTQYCAGAGDNSSLQGTTIIGAPALRAYITLLDEGNSQVGFLHQTYCQ